MKPARRPSHTGAACGPVFCVFLCRFLLTAGQNAVILYVIPQRFIVVRNYVVLDKIKFRGENYHVKR